ncbi:ATP-binding protein [Streptomyces sp. NBC_01637]|uniref:ATP-binding protein n=1 Tax=unclassified Streptomyces TaxID=2593676 RepID=UPI00386FF598|nr:ATP-binding protein [Streptomyces sp. NBC_01653]WTD38186.1 ATP-binding protein [Streptomyces sp. NBC_01643]WTD93560.1 ATP-binding protein [Streptomyces sp. NBC_01637]
MDGSVEHLGQLDFLTARENVILLGPVGTGSSHFAEGLAQAAIENDLRVAWFTLETLSAAIGKSKVDGPTARIAARMCRADLIVIDDVGLLPVGADAPKRSTASSTPPTNAAPSR